MKAGNQFLLALVSKLEEIAESTSDMNTQNELQEFIEIIVSSLQ